MNLQENIQRIKELLITEEHKGWGNSDEKLENTFKFKDFDESIDFVNKVAKIAEKQNHHPDICIINYNQVKISITDHDKGRVSERCHKFVDAVTKMMEKKSDVTEEKDETAKYVKCRNCKKKYTQTIHKGKKSKPICPHCGTHEDLEGSN